MSIEERAEPSDPKRNCAHGQKKRGPLPSTLRRTSLDTLASHRAAPRTTPAPPMIGSAIQLGVSRARLAHQNAAVVQTCVPTVVAQGRQLPPTRQGPRRPDARKERRNRLTDHPRRPSPRPQTALTGPSAIRRGPGPDAARKRPSPLRPRPTGLGLRDDGRFPRRSQNAGWDTFQPAQVVHFSTGLDTLARRSRALSQKGGWR